MTFSDKLKSLMRETGLTQTKLSELTGISKPNLSQYIHDKHEPSKERRHEIARALGLDENYFEMFLPKVEIVQDKVTNLTPQLVAKLMHKSVDWVQKGLQQGRLPWGYAVKMKDWSYWISSVKFTEYTGIEVPLNEAEVIR